MGPLDRAEDERLVLALRAGDQEAFGRLFERWYDRVHELARRITRDDGLAADVAQDAFLAAWQRLDRLEDAAAFGGWLLRIARNRALDVVRAPAHTRTETDDDVSLLVDEQAVASRAAALEDPALVAGDREVQDLVWSAAATLGERDLTALDLSLRHGLEPAEIGEVLGINRNAANQLVHRMKGRLATAVGCRVLWRGGAPACADLASVLEADGVDRFDAQAVRVADRHAERCEECSRRRETRLAPAQLFAAVPVAIAPVLLKAKAAAALDAAGVPMGGVGGGAGGSPDGSGPGADGAGEEYADPGGPHRRRGPSRRALAIGAAAVAVVAAVLTVPAIESLDDGGHVERVPAPVVIDPTSPDPVESTTTTTEADRGGPVAPTTVPVDPPEGEDRPAPDPTVDPDPGGPSTPPPPPPPFPPPAAPTATLSLSVSVVGSVHPVSAQATVFWTTSGTRTVTVSGPGVFAGGVSGSEAVCPGSIVTSPDAASVCRTNPGSYSYRLTAHGPGGSVQRTVTLTVR